MAELNPAAWKTNTEGMNTVEPMVPGRDTINPELLPDGGGVYTSGDTTIGITGNKVSTIVDPDSPVIKNTSGLSLDTEKYVSSVNGETGAVVFQTYQSIVRESLVFDSQSATQEFYIPSGFNRADIYGIMSDLGGGSLDNGYPSVQVDLTAKFPNATPPMTDITLYQGGTQLIDQPNNHVVATITDGTWPTGATTLYLELELSHSDFTQE